MQQLIEYFHSMRHKVQMEKQTIIDDILSVLSLDELSKSRINQELASDLIDSISEEENLSESNTLQ